MLFRKKQDTINSNFSGEPIREVYVCAEQNDDGDVILYEQYEGVNKEGPHSITKKVTVDKEFIKKLSKKL